jgi:truncated hemoglobin YjbI
MLAVLVMLVGCNKSGTSADTSTDVTGSTASTAAPAPTGQSLMDQLGGTSGVNQLADAFAANLASTTSLSPALNSDAITAAKQGLVNEIAKASGVAEPNPGASLLGALSGKGLSSDQVSAVSSALSSAADGMNVSPPAKSSLMGIMAPVSKALAG